MTGSEEDSRRLARFAGQLASPRSSTDREFYTRRRRLVLPTLAGKAVASSELAAAAAPYLDKRGTGGGYSRIRS